MRIGYHASHEQYAPSELLACVRHAEAAGFAGAMCADHFHPWLEDQGHSGFAWGWLGAALHATSMPFGTVNAPGDRYHPAIIAQAAATLAEMFPGRFWMAVGSGEALNEHVTGAPWPAKAQRNARLRECADVMRALWRGETVSHRGRVVVDEARLYTLPDRPPRLLGAAVSDETAEFLGSFTDGLITTGRRPDEMRSIIESYRRGGGDGKPIIVQHALSWAPTEAEALQGAHEQWRFCTVTGERLWSLRTPADFARATAGVTPADVAKVVRVSADLGLHAQWIAEYAEAGVSEVYCHNVGRNQDRFIETFGRLVLPQLAGQAHQTCLEAR